MQALTTGGWLAVFASGPDGALGGRWQTAPTLEWSKWMDLGPAISDDPAVFENADGRLELFAIGPDGLLGHCCQLAAGGWSDWDDLGPADAGHPAVFQNADGRLEVFSSGFDGSLGHVWQLEPGGHSGWSDWEDFGPSISGDPALFQNADGRLEVFAIGPSGLLGHRWQLEHGGWSGWSDWEDFGPTISGHPAVFQNLDGRLELFATGPDGLLGHIWQADANGESGWGTWEDLGPGVSSDPALFQNADGRLEVFATGPEGRLGHRWQLEPGGRGWSDWDDLGPAISGHPAVFQNADGRLEVFARGPEGSLGHVWQFDPSGQSGWSSWEDLGPALSGRHLAVRQTGDPGNNQHEAPRKAVQRTGRPRVSSVLTADVCVIGAGPAGITVSDDLVRAGASVILADSGQLDHDHAAQELNRGFADGPIIKGHWRYLRDGRARAVQGSASLWGPGWCMAFRALDFKHRPWITYSGWPLTPADVAPYEAVAAATFGFDAFNVPLPDGPLSRVSFHFPPDPQVFRTMFVNLLGKSRFRPELGATAVELAVRDERIESVRFARSDGGELRVHADNVVLAGGAIENARLLLIHEDALRSTSGMAGMYFMEHPHVLAGSVSLADASAWRSCLEANGRLDVLTLDDTRQWDQRLHNATVQLRPRDDMSTRAGPVECLLYVRAEQAPNPDSRVLLSDRTDRFGSPWPILHWRLLPRDWNSIVRTTELVAGALEEHHGAAAELFIGFDYPWPWRPAGPGYSENATWGNHHLGTTRMSDSPADGVVDRNCLVHGTANLYVAGSSVFPTGGCANPTFMIVALAHRLADHLTAI